MAPLSLFLPLLSCLSFNSTIPDTLVLIPLDCEGTWWVPYTLSTKETNLVVWGKTEG